jgi:hypothetical protein
MRSIFTIAAVVLLCGLFLQPERYRYYGPGVLVPEPPIQERLFFEPSGLDLPGYEVTPLAEFKGEARVLARKDYWLGREAEISPTDIVLGWGPMSDERILEKISFEQRNRFYFWRTDIRLAPYTIQYNSANMHLIPAHRLIKETDFSGKAPPRASIPALARASWSG